MELNRTIEIIKAYLDMDCRSYKGKLINKISCLKIIEKYFEPIDSINYRKLKKAGERLYLEYSNARFLDLDKTNPSLCITYADSLIFGFLNSKKMR